MPKEEFEMNEKPKRRKGIRFGPFPLFLLTVVIVGAIAAIVVMTVFFVQQGEEINNLENERDELKNRTLPPRPTPPATPQPTQSVQPSTVTATLLPPATTVPPVTPGSTAIPVTTAAPVFRESYRLPVDVTPLHYNIQLQLFLPFDTSEENMTNAFTTAGDTTIFIRCENATNVIIFHAWNLTILPGRVLLFDALQREVEIAQVRTDDVRHFLILQLVNNLTPGELYSVQVKFAGLIVSESQGTGQGLYRSQYTLPNGQQRWLASTQFQPMKARRMFPCFDEPAMRATFDLTVKHDVRFTGVFSVRKIVAQAAVAGTDGKWIETRFDRTVKQPTYLLALIVSDFGRDASITEEENIDFGVISRKEALPDAVFAKNVGINMTQHFGRLFNMSYNLYNSKLDMAAVPDFDAGAMENWGLIIYREIYMLYRSGFSSAVDKNQVAAVVAHELAHQWFGNPVTCSWWSESFLNEGFATLLEYPLLEAALPTWQNAKTFTISEHRVAFDADSYETSVPLYNPSVQTPAEIENMFGRITYQKGASVLRMIEKVMGTENFYAALKTYLAERSAAGGYTTYIHLLNAFTAQMQMLAPGTITMNFRDRFDEWITTSGFPLVTIIRTEDKIILTQERFLFNRNVSDPHPRSEDRAWNIPFTFIVKKESDTTEQLLLQQTDGSVKPRWFEKSAAATNMEISLEPGVKWVLGNIQSQGFYRINYDTANWVALTDQLATNHTAIELFSRVELIEDSFVLARKGLVNYNIPINLIRYLPSEDEYPPWSSTFESLRYIDEMVRVKNSATISAYMRKILTTKYVDTFWNSEEVWQEDVKEDYQQIMLRSAVVENACYYEVPGCLLQAGTEFKEWEDNANNAAFRIDPHFKDHIFCYGMRNGTPADFEHMEKEFLKADVHATKLSILRGMGCSKNDTHILSMLKMILDGRVRSQDSVYAIRYATKFPAGHMLAWGFLKENWAKLPANSRDGMVGDVCGKFNTPEMLKEVNDFLTVLGGTIPEKISFESAMARIRSNIAWMSENSAAVLTALELRIASPAQFAF